MKNFTKLQTKISVLNIDNWLSANWLILNTDTTHYMIFCTAKTKPPSNNLTLTIRNDCVSQQSKTRFLGIIFPEHLNWKPHMEFILKKTLYHLWYY